MNAFRTNWPLAMSAALTLTLMSGVADARGGGHAGAVAHPMAPASHMATTPSPGVGLPGAHPVSGLPGGNQPHAIGAMHSPAATTVTSPAMASTPQATHSAAGAPKANGSAAAAAAAAAALSFSGIDTSPPPPPPDRVTPPSAIAAPEPELAPIAPLSPQLPTQFATGGVTQPNLALSPSASSCGQPERIGAKHAWRRRQVAGRLHGLLGPRDAHEQGRVEGGLRAHHAGLPDRSALTAIVGASRDRENQGPQGSAVVATTSTPNER